MSQSRINQGERGPSRGPDDALGDPGGTKAQFQSVLFAGRQVPPPRGGEEAPDFFGDLNLDQIIQSVLAKWQAYNLKPFFYTPLHDFDLILYRQEIMRDLENPLVMQSVELFSQDMREMRSLLPADEKQYYKFERERWFLSAVVTYCRTISVFARALTELNLESRGMRIFREFLIGYIATRSFVNLSKEATALTSEVSAIKYCLHIDSGRVTVRRYADELDYSKAVEDAFDKFRQDEVNDYSVKGLHSGGMNHIQAQIVERIALLYPGTFQALEKFYELHSDFQDNKISRFDREIQFYVAYLKHKEKVQSAGLNFCFPELSNNSKEIRCQETFDLALANKLVDEKASIITNDFFMRGSERIFVVSGPNHGGKTTFARTFGQLHYLAALGCPVPGRDARLFHFDRLFTHFEREENIQTLRGKLQDDLLRVRQILDHATSNSIVIINEIFSSTSLKDAVYLGKKIMTRLSELDVLAVCVTFLDELASFDEKTVSIVSTVDPNNPAIRTFKLERRRADGLAYALAVAEKHRVTSDWLLRRIKS